MRATGRSTVSLRRTVSMTVKSRLMRMTFQKVTLAAREMLSPEKGIPRFYESRFRNSVIQQVMTNATSKKKVK